MTCEGGAPAPLFFDGCVADQCPGSLYPTSESKRHPQRFHVHSSQRLSMEGEVKRHLSHRRLNYGLTSGVDPRALQRPVLRRRLQH
jgi:hypothetical protein